VKTIITARLGATIEVIIGQPLISLDGTANRPVSDIISVKKTNNPLKIPIFDFRVSIIESS